MTTYLGKTTTFKDSSGNIGNIKELGSYKPTADIHDVTTYGSGYVREFAAGLMDGGTIVVTCFYDPNNDASLNYLYYRLYTDPSKNTSTYTITLPGAKTIIFTGIVQDLEMNTPLGEEMTFTVTLKISGAITGTFGT